MSRFDRIFSRLLVTKWQLKGKALANARRNKLNVHEESRVKTHV